MTLVSRATCLSLLCLVFTETAASPVALPYDKGAPAVIRLDAPLTEKTRESFARRLSDLVGVEVRLPRSTGRLPTLEAGEWTAVRLLNRVGKSLGASWEVRYELTGAAGESDGGRKSKLPPAGKITLRTKGLTLKRAVQLIEREAPCVISLPRKTPEGRFHLEWREAPLERVLADLARTAGLHVRTVVVFELPHESQARQARAEEERLAQELQQQAEIANRLQELYGADPGSDEFPWDGIDRDAVARTLAQELDLDVASVEALMERLRINGSNAPVAE